jgi:hypothetical protein
MRSVAHALPALCFKRGVGDTNFSRHIPYEAHVETPTRRALVAFIQAPGEPSAAKLFSPPGFGKTDTVASAALMTNAMYLRVSAKSNPLMVKLQLAYQDRFDEMKEEQLLCCDLERRVKDISFSFVACLFEAISAQIEEVWASLELAPHTKFALQQPHTPHASQASEAANYLPELRKNGFHLEANYTQALTDASNTLRKTCESRSSKLVLHLDELNLFAVHKDFKRQHDQGSVSRDDWPGYRLISLSDAIYSGLGGSPQLRVVFSGTSHAAGHLLRFATELKPAKIPPLRETSVEFVDHVLRHFLVLDHLDPDYVQNLCAQLAGCARSLEWFLHYLALEFGAIAASDLRPADYDLALIHARKSFAGQCSNNLIPHKEDSKHVANDALLAFAFFGLYGGTRDDDERITFQAADVPLEWNNWSAAGAIHLLELPDGALQLQTPFPFLRDFLFENAKLVQSHDQQQLHSFMLACVAQPDTFPGVAFQFAVALELQSTESPLLVAICKAFHPLQLAPSPRLPPVHLFTLFDEIPHPHSHVYMVVDKHTDGARYVDVASQVDEGSDTHQATPLKMEIKRVVDDAKLRSACLDFFKKCEESKDDHALNLFLSYHPMRLDGIRSGSVVKEIKRFLQKPRYAVLHGNELFRDCHLPFAKMTPPSAARDVVAFRRTVLSAVGSPSKRRSQY